MIKHLYIRRWVMGVNAILAVGLAALLVLMLNYISSQHNFQIDLSRSHYLSLSPKTMKLLEQLSSDIQVIVLMKAKYQFRNEVVYLLREYEHVARGRLHVEYVNPNRDLGRTKEVALKYNLTDPDTVIFESANGRSTIVTLKEISGKTESSTLTGFTSTTVSFRGEQSFSSAIQKLARTEKPVVYFLTGHGEHQIDNYDRYSGYSIIARAIQRNNTKVKSLRLENSAEAIPKDCRLLIIAGPVKSLTQFEVKIIKTYLDNFGRLLLMLDASVDSGLEPMLEAWGVSLHKDRVYGSTLTGRDLLTTNYGNHPITVQMRNITTIFLIPRSITPVSARSIPASVQADKPRVTVLASTSSEGWAEMSPRQRPPKFDSGVDRAGPIPVAVAVEKGPLGGMDVEIKTTRLVIIGDSVFISNAGLLAGYNTDFFLNTLNWLLEIKGSFEVKPYQPALVRVILSKRQLQLIYAAIVVILPAIIAITGLIILFRRRK